MLCGQCSEENADIVIDLLSKVGGACTYCYEVTPTSQKAITYDEESWKPRPEDPPQREKSPDPSAPSTSSSSKSSSKAKKVKKYLKKCKNALGSSKTSSFDCETASQVSTNSSSSWYVDPQLEGLIQKGEIHEIVEQFEDEVIDLQDSKIVKFQVANIIQVKLPNGVEPEDTCSKKSASIEENFQSALSSVSTETLKSDDCEYFSLDSRTFERDETDYKHKQNVIEFSFCNSRTNSENWDYSDSVTTGGTAEVDSKAGLGDGRKTVPISASPVLDGSQDVVDGTEVGNGLAANTPPVKSEVEGLIDKYFCSIYQNYSESKKCLVRQARDLLVCEYRGCLSRFESEFCSQASKLLQHLKNEQSADLSSPSGWPLCLGRSGVVVHFTPLDVSHLRNRDCYLTLTRKHTPILEVTLIWKLHQEIHSRTVAEFRNPLNSIDDIMCSSVRAVADLKVGCADECDGSQLPELLQNLLVSVEHAIKRVPLDDLTFPCPQCQQYLPLDRQEDDQSSCSCQCLCRPPDSTVTKKDSSMQTSPMFEFVGSIPHIDSDSDDDKETIRTGAPNKKMEIARPRSISELPEKLLMSGINLPGTIDNDGRPIILCYAECISRAALNKYEIAKLLLYYTSIPTSESREKGFTILLLAENEADYKMLEMLDKSICLIGNCIKIHRFLIWTSGMAGGKNDKDSRTLASQVEAILVTEESSLKEYLAQDQTPASCGGTCIHDQLEWVEFFKQLEPFITTCTSAGQSLLKTLSHLRSEEVPPQVTRRFLNHQCRQISRALDSETVQRLRREGNKTVTSLAERGQWLASSRDVKRSTTFASDSYNAVERVTKRLEQLRLERMERLKELARYRTMQDEAEELLQWTKNVGDEKIGNLTLLLCSSADSKGVKEVANNFDEFFFIAWKQIEKSNDLTEECKNIVDSKAQHLKEVCSSLAAQMRSFREHLEETRERIEDSSRCFLLLETCQDILEDDSAEQEEFFKLAERSGNEKLLQLSKNFKNSNSLPKPHDHPPDKPAGPDKSLSLYSSSEFSASSTPQRSQNTQIRRRSVSSMAYIYHCSHHAAGELCNCCESDTENSVSYKLKKRYIQMHNCNCQAAATRELERKNSGTLGGIKEERESVENLLEKIENLDSNCKRCDSGLSTADNSVGDDSSHSYKESKMKMQRMCSCQYYKETCTICSNGSSSGGSSQDNAENQQDSINDDRFNKSHSSDEIEDDPYMEDRRKVPPVQANNHLYCHASTLDLPSDALYHTMEPKTQKTLTYIIREMIETERDYVRSLDYIIVNYIPELQREDIPQALRGHRNTVFGNVEKIYEFHSHSFLEELEECEHNPLQVGQIFLKYDKKFYLYALYNKNKPKSDSLMSEYGSLFFKSKQMELGDRMDLASYLLKPVQRMGKYALLLQQMMKACTPALMNSPERNIQELEDLRQAEEMVRFQLRHGNDLLAMDSIRECDVNLKEQGRLLRQNEFLVWEGRSGKKSLRQVFLFEELILFSKARRFPDRKNLDLYIYKNSIKMTDIGLTARIGETPTKFEIWFRKRKPNDTFTLQSMSEDVKRAWTEELSQLLWKQAIRNRAVRMAEMSSMGIGNKPCLDIRPSADQISDRSISIAQLSKTAPRFRNSIAGPAPESCRTIKRPHSVISVSSVSSSSTSSGGSGGHSTSQGHSSIGFDSNFDSPKPYRSATLNSQCSVESGIIADISVASDDYTEQSQHTTS